MFMISQVATQKLEKKLSFEKDYISNLQEFKINFQNRLQMKKYLKQKL